MATDDLEIEIELPQGKVEELLNQLSLKDSSLNNNLPIAGIGVLESAAHKSGEVAGYSLPPSDADAVANFDPIERLARLREMQSRYAQVGARRNHAESTRQNLTQVPQARMFAPQAGEKWPAPTAMDPNNMLVPGAGQDTNQAPFPPPGGLPFPYAGVPGVLAPRVKAPPAPLADPIKGEELTVDDPNNPSAGQDDEEPDEETSKGVLPQADLLFKKDGLDMSFQHLRTHGLRMQATVRELGRQIDEGEELKKVQELQADPEVMRQYMEQQRIIYEQQRVMDEARWDRHLEEEAQWWTARQGRSLEQRRIYGDEAKRIYGEPTEEELAGLASAAPDLLDASLTVRSPSPTFGGEAAKKARADTFASRSIPRVRDISTADAGKSGREAFAYLDPDGVSPSSPKSYFPSDLPASQSYHRQLVRDGVVQEWPAAPQYIPQQAQRPQNGPSGDEIARGFFAGFAERGAANRQDIGEESTSTPRSQRAKPFSGFPERGAANGQELGEEGTSTPRSRRAKYSPRLAAFAGYGDGSATSQATQYRARGVSPFANKSPRSQRTLADNASFASDELSTPSQHGHIMSSTASSGPRPNARGTTRQFKFGEARNLKTDTSRSSTAPRVPFAAFAGEGGNPDSGDDTERDDGDGDKDFVVRGAGTTATLETPDDDERREAGVFGLGRSAAKQAGALVDVDIDSTTEKAQKKRIEELSTSSKFMPGACLDKALPLKPPDLDAIRLAKNDGVERACERIQSIRRAGHIGDPKVAQIVLDYCAALANSAADVASYGDVTRHISLVADLLAFYPLAVQIHLWGLEAMMNLYEAEEHRAANDSIASPIFDSVSELIVIHESDRKLTENVPELPRRLVSALAMVLGPSTAVRLTVQHVDFTLRVLNKGTRQRTGVGPVLAEHGMQVFVSSKLVHRLDEQAEAASGCLTNFRAEPKLVSRAMLALHAIYSVASEDPREKDGKVIGKKSRKKPDPKEQDPRKEAVEELLVQDKKNKKKDEESEVVPIGVRQIVSSMDLYARDRKLQGAGALALSAATRMADVGYQIGDLGVSFRAINREGMLRAMVYAQQHHASSRSVALSICQIVQKQVRREPKLLGMDILLNVIDAMSAFQRDPEIVVVGLDAANAVAARFHELCDPSGDTKKVSQIAQDLVRLVEHHHKNPTALGAVLVTICAACSDGTGALPGHNKAAQWREAFGKAAAVAVPMRVFYEHPDNNDLIIAAGVALRILTYGSPGSCKHAGRLRAGTALLSSIQSFSRYPDIVRELLSALGNCASEQSVRQNYQEGMPDTGEVIYIAMMLSAQEDPDILAQGCRALHALSKTLSSDAGEWEWEKIKYACEKVAKRIAQNKGERLTAQNQYGDEIPSPFVAKETDRLRGVCYELLSGYIAVGPQFGRILDDTAEPILEVVPTRSHSVKIPESRKQSRYYRPEN